MDSTKKKRSYYHSQYVLQKRKQKDIEKRKIMGMTIDY